MRELVILDEIRIPIWRRLSGTEEIDTVLKIERSKDLGYERGSYQGIRAYSRK